MQLDLNEYKNKKVFITGHTGFKGGWLLAILNKLGANIVGYALAPESKMGIYTIIEGDNKCLSIIADIRDKKKLESEILNFKPDYIFHLAAQPLVRLSYAAPSETYEINVLGTSYLLDAVRKLKNNCNVVVVTTDKVYQNNEDGKPFKENDRLGGHDPYSTSKACAELVVESFNKSYFIQQETPKIKLVTARAGNVIGGGDYSSDRIIPDLIKAFNKNARVEIRNPNAVRPWQHVIEPIVGYLMLGLFLNNNQKKYSYAYNFGPSYSDNLSVKDLVELAINQWGGGSYSVIEQKDLHEAGLLRLDIEKVKNELGWCPKLKAEEAIKYTIDWYKSIDKNLVTNKQIAEYLNLLN